MCYSAICILTVKWGKNTISISGSCLYRISGIIALYVNSHLCDLCSLTGNIADGGSCLINIETAECQNGNHDHCQNSSANKAACVSGMPYQQPDNGCDHRKYNADDQHINGRDHLGHCQKSHKNNRKHNDDDGDHRAWYPVVSSSPSTHLLAPFLFLLSLRAAVHFIVSTYQKHILYFIRWQLENQVK